jgi:membrane protease YdiL (CAAX protease family)
MFAAERSGSLETSFGYHGVWNMPRAVGTEAFWQIYRHLDDRSTVRHDFASIVKALKHGSGGFSRMARMTVDHVKFTFGIRC